MEDFIPEPPRPRKLRNPAVLLILVLLVSCGIYFILYGLTFPPCAEREKELEVPSYLTEPDTYLVFELPMAYVEPPEKGPQNPRIKNCTNTDMSSKGLLRTVTSNGPNPFSATRNGYHVSLVPENMSFIVERRAYIDCFGLGLPCIGGSDYDTLLLRDAHGDRWKVSPLFLKNYDRGYRERPWRAGYYRDGVRLGDAAIEYVP